MSTDVEFSFKTKGNAEPTGRSKIYFTCHPEDFGSTFDRICSDLFDAASCAVYYTPDMSADLSSENNRVDLERMELFVIPVTMKLLLQDCRAMGYDFMFAKQKHIPVLPIMMEYGLDTVYSRPDKFGELQYIDKFNTDTTAISYKEKLSKYLDGVLYSDDLENNVRSAFSSYMFLSYRKKDRAFANKLMRAIHEIPQCRDTAIWFDEFLTPGESYRNNIEKMMKQSDFFTLVVTPSLLEYNDGRPNFVMGVEYPKAKELNKCIIPIEMAQTDSKELSNCYDGISDVIDFSDIEGFKAAIADLVCSAGKSAEDSSPKHKYYIARAYLHGIDVEVNVEKSLALFEESANENCLESMETLYNIYGQGYKVPVSFEKEVYWAKRRADLSVEKYGKSDPYTLDSLRLLVSSCNNAGKYHEAYKTALELYQLQCVLLGEEHKYTMSTLEQLALAIGYCGHYEEKLEIMKKIYRLKCKINGKTSASAATTLHNLGTAYFGLDKYSEALSAYKESYAELCRLYGEDSQQALLSINNQAQCYSNLGDFSKAVEMDEKNYRDRCRVLGEEHPDTIHTLNNLACEYLTQKEFEKAFETAKKAYELKCKVFGKEHPYTLDTLWLLAETYLTKGNTKKAIDLFTLAYRTFVNVLGKDHPKTAAALHDLNQYLVKINTPEQIGPIEGIRIDPVKKADNCKELINTQINEGSLYFKLGDYEAAAKHFMSVYNMIPYKEEKLTVAQKLLTSYKHLNSKSKCWSLQCDIFQLRSEILAEKIIKKYNEKRN